MDSGLITSILETLNQGGVIGAGVLIIVGLVSGQIVSKARLDEVRTERDECRDELRELQRDRRRR